MLQATKIREFLHDPHGDGVLIWAAQTGQRGKEGEVAGYLHYVKFENRWTIQLAGRKYLRSRLVFALYNDRWPLDGMVLDHMDKNTLNDSISNLQEVTQQVNMITRKRPWGHMKEA